MKQKLKDKKQMDDLSAEDLKRIESEMIVLVDEEDKKKFNNLLESIPPNIPYYNLRLGITDIGIEVKENPNAYLKYIKDFILPIKRARIILRIGSIIFNNLYKFYKLENKKSFIKLMYLLSDDELYEHDVHINDLNNAIILLFVLGSITIPEIGEDKINTVATVH
jgi:hypothetical protein